MLPCGFPIKPTSILRVSALFFISCGDNAKNVKNVKNVTLKIPLTITIMT